MMSALKKKTGVAIVLVLAVNISSAQFYRDMSVGFNAGAFIYQGDLTPERFGAFKTASAGLTVYAKKPINHFLSARLNFNFAKLKADESKYSKPEWRQQRNFAFTTPVTEFCALLEWNVLGKNYEDNGFMPYIFTGAGFSFLKIKPDYSGLNRTIFGEGTNVQNGLAADIIHGVPKTIAVLPVGIGVEKSMFERFSMNIETTYRFLFTDYLDGFSQSANPQNQDHYHSTTIGIKYKFGKKGNSMGCPAMNN